MAYFGLGHGVILGVFFGFGFFCLDQLVVIYGFFPEVVVLYGVHLDVHFFIEFGYLFLNLRGEEVLSAGLVFLEVNDVVFEV